MSKGSHHHKLIKVYFLCEITKDSKNEQEFKP